MSEEATQAEQKEEKVAESTEASTSAAPAVKSSRGKKKKKKKFVTHGQAHIQASYNNTIVTLTDGSGNALAWGSSGMAGFKGPKKATPYAAGIIVRNVTEKVRDTGLKTLDVFVKGIGSGREAAIRALSAQGFTINSIKDITPTPHNGCRPRKVRRV
ncbi:MAG: 30S ribosomal protein S11 [Candidatus Nomurabacteria bacterium]|nr:MAG: 30S ribosomal protein S11 [Candidatus Nomurabacteria bacterium]